MLFGNTIRILGDFFYSLDSTIDPEIFIEKHRDIMGTFKQFISKLVCLYILKIYINIFLRCDEVRPSYSGPHKVKRRLDDRRFIIIVSGVEKNCFSRKIKTSIYSKSEF